MPYKDRLKQREYQNSWTKKRRVAWLTENGPCECGSWVDLEVDHVDPSQKVTHRVWTWTAARRAVELAKCRARCKECHSKKSKTEYLQGAKLPHTKLSEEQALEIKHSTEKGVVLARRFGVDPALICKIRAGQRWKYLP